MAHRALLHPPLHAAWDHRSEKNLLHPYRGPPVTPGATAGVRRPSGPPSARVDEALPLDANVRERERDERVEVGIAMGLQASDGRVPEVGSGGNPISFWPGWKEMDGGWIGEGGQRHPGAEMKDGPNDWNRMLFNVWKARGQRLLPSTVGRTKTPARVAASFAGFLSHGSHYVFFEAKIKVDEELKPLVNPEVRGLA